MKYFDMAELNGKLYPLGRTLLDHDSKILYFNWTLSGVELWFQGRVLMAVLDALPGIEQDRNAATGQTVQRNTWPWCAVVLDDDQAPARTFEVSGCQVQLLYFSEQEKLHRIRLIKQTENGKGYLGLRGLWGDGEVLELPQQPAHKKIVFIGDSITCGFGNSCEERERLFFSADEDGWQTHGAIAARLLGMEPSVISSSGICVTSYRGWPHPYSMDELYDYTDRMLEDMLGRKHLTRWDFMSHPVDYVVLNLGTNDANGMMLEGAEGTLHHARSYRAFLEHLRKVHPDAYILCALGSMDYYLFTDIQGIVTEYQRDTADQRVGCFRYPKMDIRDPVGACGHPHITSQHRMAYALAEYIMALEEKQDKTGGKV